MCVELSRYRYVLYIYIYPAALWDSARGRGGGDPLKMHVPMVSCNTISKVKTIFIFFVFAPGTLTVTYGIDPEELSRKQFRRLPSSALQLQVVDIALLCCVLL